MLEEQLEDNVSNDEDTESTSSAVPKKPGKRGIIYLSTIPQYMNVSKIREFFGKFGKIGNVYLQLANTGQDKKKRKPKNVAKLFTEGWVEFERKSVAKRVAALLNSKQVDTRKGSKQYDCMWNIKYLQRFKWVHLHERLAHERMLRQKKRLEDVRLSKKQANSFKACLGKKNITETENLDVREPEAEDSSGSRDNFLQSVWSN